MSQMWHLGRWDGARRCAGGREHAIFQSK